MAQDKRNPIRTYAKGETLFKQGEPVRSVFFLQTGLVGMSVASQSGRVEAYQATAPQVVGSEALQGAAVYETTAVALNDTAVIEFPAEVAAQAVAKAVPAHKFILTGMINKIAAIHAELRSIKLQSDPTPCPPALTAKMFATVFHVVSYSGTPKGDTLRIVWPSFRKYCQRVFGESPVRLEQLVYLLSTLGYAELEMVASDTDPDGPEELGFVRFKDIAQIESFAEFFKKRLSALGPEKCMDVFDPCLQAAEILQRNFSTQPVEQIGKRSVSLNAALTILKAELAPQPMALSDFEKLVKRGLPVEIAGNEIRFIPSGFQRLFKNFRILGKIVEWNRVGRAPGAPDPDANKKKKESKGS
jgi:hypothetical protein